MVTCLIKIPKNHDWTSGKLSGHRWTRGFCHSWSTQVILMPLGEEKDTSLWRGVGPCTHTSSESLFISSLQMLIFQWPSFLPLNSLKKRTAKARQVSRIGIRFCTKLTNESAETVKDKSWTILSPFFLERPRKRSVKKKPNDSFGHYEGDEILSFVHPAW